ncbi:MAG: WXG100 family type VII secretion target [Catonella sp.]|jgi:hypothetical protein|nr:MAG: WXG100 family type VII secretion target [Lachnospiraceae bacterium]
MPEIKVSTESLKQEAENAVSNIHKMKNVLEEQKEIIKSMSSYWEGDGYTTATDSYMKLSDKSLSVLKELEDIPAKMFDIAQIYELTEEMLNEDLSSDIPDYLLE